MSQTRLAPNAAAAGTSATGANRICRCEAKIAPCLLDGYACGNPDCWRTAAAARAFEAFVAELVRTRGVAAKEPASAAES